MSIENKLYPNFKSYNQYKTYANKTSQLPKQHNKNIAPLVGSVLGVGAGMLACKKMPKSDSGFIEAVRTFAMATGANIGGVLFGSIGATNQQKKKKWKEAGFQIMNIGIPMALVASILEICKKVKPLNNNPVKIIGSIAGMVSGAMIATIITNATREKGTPIRKYTLKDSIANFDDIAATIVIGFPQYEKLNAVAKTVLPLICAYGGLRAGKKE